MNSQRLSVSSKQRDSRPQWQSATFITSRVAGLVLLLSVFVTPGAVWAQRADGFNPNPNGGIGAIAVQPDGKIVIGGNFTNLSPNGGAAVPRSNIARLYADGAVDPTFDPNVDGAVYCIVLQPDGKILIGGGFSTVGGQVRHHIARLDANTGLVDSFDPDADRSVSAIALQADGKVLVGGVFSNIGAQSRMVIARIDSVNGLADSFNPNISGYPPWVNTIAIQTDDKIVIGGFFGAVGGQNRSCIARVYPDGTVDSTFDPHASGNLYNDVTALTLQADGGTLVGGYFLFIGGQTRYHIGRLDGATGLADSFDPHVADDSYAYFLTYISSLVVEQDGKILVGGRWYGDHNVIGGQVRNYMARLNPVSGSADSFDPYPSGTVVAIALQPDGKILVSGGFTSIGGQPRRYMARLEPNTPTSGCALGVGYWKNHPEAWCLYRFLPNCDGYSQEQAIAIMRHNPSHDKTYSLAQQLFAAKLNISCIGSTSSCITSAIGQGENWLCRHRVGSDVTANSPAWQEISAIHTTLSQFNDGQLCAPTCGP